MKDNNDGFVRADQIDLKSLDEQLERHLNRALNMEKYKKQRNSDDNILVTTAAAFVNATATAIGKASNFLKRQRQECTGTS